MLKWEVGSDWKSEGGMREWEKKKVRMRKVEVGMRKWGKKKVRSWEGEKVGGI